MSEFKIIDRAACDVLREQVEQALEPIRTKHPELQIQTGSGSFNPNNFTLKVGFSMVAEDGMVMDRYAHELQKYAKLYGLKPEVLGVVIPVSRLGDCKIIGSNAKAQKYPILVRRMSTNKDYKFPAYTIQAALRAAVLDEFLLEGVATVKVPGGHILVETPPPPRTGGE